MGRSDLGIGYLGLDTGTTIAMRAAADFGLLVRAFVSYGGHPDLSAETLDRLETPTLFIVGTLDDVLIVANHRAYEEMWTERELSFVDGRTTFPDCTRTIDIGAARAVQWILRSAARPREIPQTA